MHDISLKLVNLLIEKEMKITSMESCTGGFFISCITDIENASKITDGGFVTYSNRSKVKNGVNLEILERVGAYSRETAIDMARACEENSFDKEKLISVGITGTLTNAEENNESKVYYSIKYPNGNIQTNLMTLETTMPRHLMKEFVVKVIMNEIINYIIDKK